MIDEEILITMDDVKIAPLRWFSDPDLEDINVEPSTDLLIGTGDGRLKKPSWKQSN